MANTQFKVGDSIKLVKGIRESGFPQEGTVTRVYKRKLWVLLPICCRLSIDKSECVKVKG